MTSRWAGMMTAALAMAALIGLPGAAASPPRPASTGSLYDWPFSMTDLKGQTTTLAAWRGKNVVLAMDHTGSIVVCSQTSRRLRAIQNSALRMGKSIDILVISLDPENDTPERWQRYLDGLGLPSANWHFLRPSPADAETIARRLGVNHWTEGEYLVHDLKIVRLNRNGHIIRTMEGYDRHNQRFLR